MNNININNSTQNENNTNKIQYIKLRPVIVKKRQVSSNKKSISNLKQYLLQSNTRKNTLTKVNHPDDFNKYTEKLENSMVGYQMSYSNDKKDEEKEDNFEKFINKKDKEILKKVHELNNSYDNRIMSPRSKECNIKIEINEMNYPNPLKSLGIIRNNHHIYNELSKNILTRQSESFSKQIEEIEQYNMKYGKKMPKIHITDLFIKDGNLNIPISKLNKKKEINLPTLQQKGKKELTLFAYYKYPLKNFPEGREQFSICNKNSNIIIITGGITSNMKYLSLWSLNILKLEWEKINPNIQIENRYGHTALSLNNKLYIFGGKTKYSNLSVINGLDIYSFNNNTFLNHNIQGESPEKRRNHIAIFIGSQMLIHGGINENGKILNDTYLLNVNQLKWHKCVIDKYCYCPKLLGHACSLVVPLSYLYNPKFNIYNYPENDNNKKKVIKEKGLYIFGGKTKEDGGLTNHLWILLLGKKPLEWIMPDIKGKPPAPRYFHTMNYYERGNYLIIHGGRNDSVSDNSALNDTYLLNLENLEWLNVKLYSDMDNFEILCRCGHQSIIFMDKLIILGGMNNNNYLGCSLFIINLDFSYTNKLQRKTDSQILDARIKKITKMSNFIGTLKKVKLKELETDNTINLPKIK